MFPNAPLFPERASAMAAEIDHLFFASLGIAAFFSLLIASLIFYLGIRYRRRSPDEVGRPPRPESRATTVLEVTWSVVPLGIMIGLFVWGARVYFAIARPPADATEFFVVGKQWMWKVQHPEGNREINELHVPIGRPFKLTMTSEDVIHSFFIPAFRIKQDVLPGRYTTLWFQADRPGTYHLFCAQYCGAEHSKMAGWVIVMDPVEYQRWLSGSIRGESMAAAGAQLYQQFGCVTCHGTGKGPPFAGLYGQPVLLTTGQTVTADNDYLRESILDPSAKIVNGYPAIMPTFRGQISEEQLLELIAYIKSLGSAEGSLGKP